MTQAIKPRQDGEGSIGLTDRQWGDVQTKKINGKNVSDILFQGDAITQEEVVALLIALS